MDDTVMRSELFASAAGIFVLTLLLPSQAWANQPPGPQLALGEILILPLMMLFTALGGGYTVMRARNEMQGRLKWVLAAILAVLFSFTQEGLTGLLTWIFVGIAIGQGIRMIIWGLGATRLPEQRASYLAQAVPWRLISSGVLICVMAVFIAGLPVAFVGYWPFPSWVERDLKKLVAYELVKGNEHQDAAGSPHYEDPKRNPTGSGYPLLEFQDFSFDSLTGYYAVDFRIGAGTRSFEIWVWPKRFPFFPYNYLTSQPSFYADNSGQIRMIRTHNTNERCPADAPVYYRIAPEDLSRIKELIKNNKERST